MDDDGVNTSILQLLASCPHLRARWQQERADRMDDSATNPLPYVQAAALAQVVADAYAENDRDWLPGFFKNLERLLADPGNQDHELLRVGVIEDIEKSLKWAKTDTADIYRLLGPRSRTAWDATVATWDRISRSDQSDGRSARDIVADVKDPKLRKIIRDIYRPSR